MLAIIGGSGFAMVIGTFIANPWTEAGLWLANYYTGMWILGRDVDAPPNFIRFVSALSPLVERPMREWG